VRTPERLFPLPRKSSAHHLRYDKRLRLLIGFTYSEIGDTFTVVLDCRMAPPSQHPSSVESSPAPKPRDLPEECSLLRIFLGEADEYMHRPLYRAIVLRARELHLAGATVLRGPMGFGRSTHLHNAHILRLSAGGQRNLE
jgi:hypothetical protein